MASKSTHTYTLPFAHFSGTHLQHLKSWCETWAKINNNNEHDRLLLLDVFRRYFQHENCCSVWSIVACVCICVQYMHIDYIKCQSKGKSNVCCAYYAHLLRVWIISIHFSQREEKNRNLEIEQQPLWLRISFATFISSTTKNNDLLFLRCSSAHFSTWTIYWKRKISEPFLFRYPKCKKVWNSSFLDTVSFVVVVAFLSWQPTTYIFF